MNTNGTAKVELRICSSLEKVFSTQKELPLSIDKSTVLKGERVNLQLVLLSDEDTEVKVQCTAELPLELYEVKEVYSGLPIPKENSNCPLVNGGEAGYYPDLLLPIAEEITLEANKPKALWAKLETVNAEGGEYKVLFDVQGECISESTFATVRVIPESIPQQELIHINWFHTDCLATYYNVPVFSEEYWSITENFMKSAVENGVNCILTPLFTPPLDTEVGGERPTVQLVDVYKKGCTYSFGLEKLDRWVNMAKGCGVKYFEFSHFFTQWGAKHAPKIMAHTKDGLKQIFGWETKAASQGYESFLRQFSVALKAYTDQAGITELCFVHCSDEPGTDDLSHYKKASGIVRKYFGAYEQIDALSEFEFYKHGLVQTPVPEEGRIEAFCGKVPKLWTYYCCCQYCDNLPNRFFAMPSIRNRILGVLLYKYDCVGFLHWGFNFYFSQYSKRALNPFQETDAGGAFSSGDAFIVYPGENGQPLPSLRQYVFADSIRDISALRVLEQKTDRQYVLDFIESKLGNISFKSYPMESQVFLEFKEALCREVQER